MPSWEAWARTTPVRERADRVYLIELARYADSRGVLKLSRSDLATVTGASPRTISRRLTSLEEHGLLKREQTREPDGNYGRIRIQLTRETTKAQASIPRKTTTNSATAAAVEEADDHALRMILTDVASDMPGSLNALGGAISFEGPGRFRSIIAKRHSYGADTDDTISIAYEIAATEAATLAAANSPWALLATYVRTKCQQIDAEWWNDSNVALLPEGDHVHLNPITPTQEDTPSWGLDEIEDVPELQEFVQALKTAGMNPTLAETGTAIALSYLSRSPSHRHALISHDKTLAAFGVAPAQARAWLTAIAGSRRGHGGLANMCPAQLRATARSLTQAIKPTRQVA